MRRGAAQGADRIGRGNEFQMEDGYMILSRGSSVIILTLYLLLLCGIG